MNNISLMGRAVRDAEIRYSQGEKPVAYGSYTLAVDRPYRKDKEKETDFILCKVVGKSAEFAEKYIRQGTKMVVTGAMQIDNYTDKDGNKRQTAYVQIATQEFAESKNNQQTNNQPAPAPSGDMGFMSIPDDIDDSDGLPFS